MTGGYGIALDLKNIGGRFSRGALKGKRVLISGDQGNMDAEMLNWFKRFVGRDPLGTEKKFMNGEETFIYEGTICFTSNRSIYEAMDVDESLQDRLVVIGIEPLLGAKDSKLLNKLKDEASWLFNWFLSLPQDAVDHFTRAGHLHKRVQVTDNPAMRFLVENCVRDPEGRLSYDELYDGAQKIARRVTDTKSTNEV
jgi:hypothetical protein